MFLSIIRFLPFSIFLCYISPLISNFLDYLSPIPKFSFLVIFLSPSPNFFLGYLSLPIPKFFRLSFCPHPQIFLVIYLSPPLAHACQQERRSVCWPPVTPVVDPRWWTMPVRERISKRPRRVATMLPSGDVPGWGRVTLVMVPSPLHTLHP